LVIVNCLLQTVDVCLNCGTRSVVQSLRNSKDLKSTENIAQPESGINAIYSPL